MSSIRFHTADLDLSLSGSESFVCRQLELLSPYLGNVDVEALRTAEEPQPRPEPLVALPARGGDLASAPASRVAEGGEEGFAAAAETRAETLVGFFQQHEPQGPERQSDAALLFAYYLQVQEGAGSLELGDLIRCCIRTGVDTRNFNRTLGSLTRRGLLEPARDRGYRLSDQGVAAVEQRL